VSHTPRVDRTLLLIGDDFVLAVTSLAKELEIEVGELTHIFELQRKREQPFIDLWRKATGIEFSFPDYGEFLKWLMEKWETERIITGEQREHIGTLQEEYKKLEKLTIELTSTNVELTKRLETVDRERYSLKQELTHLRPFVKEKNEYITALEHDVKVLNDLSKMRQNEIEGLQRILQEEKEKSCPQCDYNSEMTSPY
jgi:hypothetical protein